MGSKNRYGSVQAVSCENGQFALVSGHFDMDSLRQAMAQHRREGHMSTCQGNTCPIVARSGAWLSATLTELDGWNAGALNLDGGTIIMGHAHSTNVTLLPVNIQAGGGTLMFDRSTKNSGKLLVDLKRMCDSHATLNLIFEGHEQQFAAYDPMMDMTLVGLAPGSDTIEGWVALRLDGNPWRIVCPTAMEGTPLPQLRREWRADGQPHVTLSLPG
ncbi:hypothetical protein ACM0P6_08775 [Komagataeibacter sucrofermentans]|uniref:Uncharacterized protein n=1 Tax=Komagataeibacter sucrofermentans TaxID=1053551 RepID=A0A318QK41_9PROT|nr:hypothetical protein [Komagataeibacter sucrofermentans]PYD80117.1 hypothetical protein CFR77_03875 [Komagataeibacter sucrofermentans]GBQ48506.1 hypothetical protein AA15973_1497 [Komagataeibacter sucrofermentans DSM 15973]